MECSKFIYESLENVATSLRLIEVLPASPDGLIRTRMRQHETPGSYHCLSYMWGDSTEEHKILVNDQSVWVRRNLYTFLQTAQCRYAEQALWIDALCINQSDDVEKSHQVQRMGEIYSCAETVFVWLGLDPALRSLSQFSKKWKTCFPCLSNRYFVLNSPDNGGLSYVFRRLSENPYWSRTWIAQEILLARELAIVSDTEEVDWNSLDDLVDAVLDQSSYGESEWNFFRDSNLFGFAQDRRTRRAAAQSSRRGGKIWDLLGWLGKSKCRDARDRIYGVLSLVQEGGTFLVDYEENLHSLFWRTGEHFQAWSSRETISMLSETLGLTAAQLRRGSSTASCIMPRLSLTIDAIYRLPKEPHEYGHLDHPPFGWSLCRSCNKHFYHKFANVSLARLEGSGSHVFVSRSSRHTLSVYYIDHAYSPSVHNAYSLEDSQTHTVVNYSPLMEAQWLVPLISKERFEIPLDYVLAALERMEEWLECNPRNSQPSHWLMPKVKDASF